MTVTGATTKQVTYQTQYLLTMLVSPTGGGTTKPKTGWYNEGTIVQISATPAKGYVFSSWTGNAYEGTLQTVRITMNGPVTETAVFVRK